jgi:DNA-directed RNA polymerase subunit M/transcription elongation factor TFIIS
MTNCPCCSNMMLRHIRAHQVYWFCRSCWAEMPLLPTLTRETSISEKKVHLYVLVK